MANSGSFATTGYQGRHLVFNWGIDHQSISGNYTVINWSLSGAGDAPSGYYNSGNFKVIIDGEQVYYSATRIQLRKGTLVASGQKTIHHNTDGKRDFTAYAEAGIYTVAVNSSGSKTWSIDDIPRASSVTCTTANIGESAIIAINKASSDFKHTLNYAFGNLTGTIDTQISESTYGWVIPEDFYAQIPNDSRGEGQIECITYNGDSQIGNSTCLFYVDANEKICKPVLEPSAEDVNELTIALTGDSNVFVKHWSIASVSVGAEARNGAAIKSQKVTCGNQSTNEDSGNIEGVESGSFIFSATDSRGFTTTEAIEKDFVEYVKLTCDLDANAPDAEGDMNFSISGKCFVGSFGVVDNTLQIFYRYKTNNEEYGEWVEVEATLNDDNTYQTDISLTGLNYQNRYTFQAKTLDLLMEVESAEKTVKTVPVFDWSEEDFNFNVPVFIKGKNLLEYIYPVGKYYISGEPTNPSILFGFGEWELQKDRFLLGVGDTYQAGTTGGEASVHLKATEMPIHSHEFLDYWGTNYDPSLGQALRACVAVNGDGIGLEGAKNERSKTADAGRGQAHNNMPPYLVVYMWKRIK